MQLIANNVRCAKAAGAHGVGGVGRDRMDALLYVASLFQPRPGIWVAESVQAAVRAEGWRDSSPGNGSPVAASPSASRSVPSKCSGDRGSGLRMIAGRGPGGGEEARFRCKSLVGARGFEPGAPSAPRLQGPGSRRNPELADRLRQAEVTTGVPFMPRHEEAFDLRAEEAVAESPLHRPQVTL